MRLSEAIRLGAMLKPQTRGRLATKSATCALGAAHEAFPPNKTVWLVTGPLNLSGRAGSAYRGETAVASMGEIERSNETPREWTVLHWHTRCPGCEAEPPATAEAPRMVLYRLIPHLNDDHHWTREQIADWVETIEAQQDAITAAPIAEVVTA